MLHAERCECVADRGCVTPAGTVRPGQLARGRLRVDELEEVDDPGTELPDL
jgi:hypothetical protein